MRYGRLQPPIEPSAVEPPKYGVNEFIDINDRLLKGKYPDGSVEILGGPQKGLAGIIFTLNQFGGTLFQKFIEVDPQIGNADGFEFIPGGVNQPDIFRSNLYDITKIDLTYNLRCGSQTGNKRAIGNLTGGSRSIREEISPANGQNNFRFTIPLFLGLVPAGEDIYSTISWTGTGNLLFLQGKMLVEYAIK